MKKLLIIIILILSFSYSRGQVSATVYGWFDQYTESFCKELTKSNISWSFCDLWGKDSICIRDMWRIIDKFHLWTGASFLPVIKIVANGQEYGYCVSCDRADVLKKIKSFIVMDVNDRSIPGLMVYNNRILNNDRSLVEVYTITGELLTQSSEPEISIEGLKSGVYVIKNSRYSVKYVKK